MATDREYIIELMKTQKQKVIGCIQEINMSAKQKFLEKFSEEDLIAYLNRLLSLDLEDLIVGE